ncbi:hypothetical protein J2X43_002905, partial [Rhizobium sp. BE258]|nr:hypothetical protein [Rhizobium sp. BE258]
RKLVDARPTYGYRRIAALLNRQRRAADLPVVNRKRVHRIMANHAMILEKHTAVRIGRAHDGKVMVMRSNLRWCSDGLEFTGKLSHGQPSPMPGYPAPTFET